MAAVGDVAERLRDEVQRAIQRNLKGLEYLSSPAPAMGLTPKTLLHQRGTMLLYHYPALVDEVYRVPVLFVMATSNKSYVFDLAPGSSLIEFMLQRGHDVYVLDWAPPRPDEKHLKLEDYVQDFLPDAVRRVQEHSGESDVNLAGYCMGGLLSALYMALHPSSPVCNLACFTTPIDFSKMELFQAWTDPKHFDVDHLVESVGIVSADFVRGGFNMLRPMPQFSANVKLWENMWNDEYVKQYRMVDRWANDTLPMAGEFFRQIIKDIFWGNKLLKGTLRVGGKKVDLGRISVPLLHVVAEHDHIVPYEAASPLVAMAGSRDKEEVVLKGGHVSLIAGASAVKRMWPKLDQWLGERSV